MTLQSTTDSLLATIVYFDLFSYPLTAQEISRYALCVPLVVSHENVLQTLDDLMGEHRIGCLFGYYYLPGREAIVELRRTRYRYAEHKYKRALWAGKLIAQIPYVRMIAVVNSLSMSNSRPESDIDFFIVAKAGHLWTVRLIATTLLQLLGVRPRSHNDADAICVSFFASEAALQCEQLTLSTDVLPDIYFYWWMCAATPIFDESDVHTRFWNLNHWVASLFPCRRQPVIASRRRVSLSAPEKIMKRIGEFIVQPFVIEKCSREIQMRYSAPEIRARANTDTRVVMTDDYLKFHTDDRRDEIRRRLSDALMAHGIHWEV